MTEEIVPERIFDVARYPDDQHAREEPEDSLQQRQPDDKGRVMVALTFNSDLGDSWEWADFPGYPEEYSALGVRVGVNYLVYAMSH